MTCDSLATAHAQTLHFGWAYIRVKNPCARTSKQKRGWAFIQDGLIFARVRYTPLGVCIIATGWGLTTINSAFLINSLALRAHSFYTRSTQPERMDGWGSLNIRKAGKRVGLTAGHGQVTCST